MVLRKSKYKDMEKFIETRNAQRKRYYQQTQGYPPRRWEPEEVQLLFNSDCTDRELSGRICRSVSAIQIKRSMVKKERCL